VNPIEIQRCLSEHPAVRECLVIAVTLSDRQNTLKAFVVMESAVFDSLHTIRMLQDYVKKKLLPHKYPRLIHFMSELPKTGTGKIDRQALLKISEREVVA
jgi:acyl-coenzyme A synthetase/AMP-(fatty) acid ligase